MIEVANAAINSFAPVAQQAQEQPSESIFVLTSTELRDIISRAVQPLLARIDTLEVTIANLEAKNAALEATQDLQSENQFILLQLINDIRKKEPGKTELSRAEKIEKYLQSRPDHRATYETLKGHLGIDNDLLGIAIKPLVASGKCAIIRTPGDKRKRSLVLLPKYTKFV